MPADSAAALFQTLQTRTRCLDIRGVGKRSREPSQDISFISLGFRLAILLCEALEHEIPGIGRGILLRQRCQCIHREDCTYSTGDVLPGLPHDGRITTGLRRHFQVSNGVCIALLFQGDRTKVIARQATRLTGRHEREILPEFDQAIGVVLPVIQGHTKPQMGLRDSF